MAFKPKKPRKVFAPKLQSLFDEEHVFEPPTNRYEELSNEAYNVFAEAPLRQKLITQHHYRRALIRATYHDTPARDIPAKDLRLLTSLTSDDPLDTKFADRIKSPVTAVRGYCVNCQGGQIAAVRNCTNGSCPLFPFRMGNNPFYGKLANADAEVTEDFNEEGEAVGDNT